MINCCMERIPSINLWALQVAKLYTFPEEL